MNRNKSYMGIDCFRFIAALLVVAIHTSPLASYSEICDFILTRILCRIGAPFFLMASGFFLITRYARNADALKAFAGKTAALYGIAILLYLPVNLYNGYFRMDYFLPNLLKDLVFDGTLYHLWYFPASIMGAAAAWYLVRKWGCSNALALSAALYGIGLFGDSYYGIAEKIPCMRSFYAHIFEISDYTRNGIFFAPVFFILGGILADGNLEIPLKKGILGFGLAFAGMFFEALVLHHNKLQRHDSMYLLLPLCMFFFFSILLHWEGKRIVLMRSLALYIYVLHPLVIVGVRLFSKLLSMQSLFVENSLVHYLAVCLISIFLSILCVMVSGRYQARRAKTKGVLQQGGNGHNTDRAWIEINVQNLEHNVQTLRAGMPPGSELMAVVKAGAYGHGAYEISTALARTGVRAFAVAVIDEGIKLRKYGIQGDILILGYTAPFRAWELKKYDLTQTAIDYNYAKLLNRQGVKVKVHIKIDTGMHRLGIPEDKPSEVEKIWKMRYLEVCGMYTHLCCADSQAEADREFTKKQIEKFYRLVRVLEKNGMKIPKLHIQSSYGLWNYPELTCDYARVGIALYGVSSTADNAPGQKLDLWPVLALRARIVLIRFVSQGESVGYGRRYTAEKDRLIAIIAIGYGDGVPRSLSDGKGSVMIRGRKAPIVGMVCMDQLAVDASGIDNISVGDIATLIDYDKDSLVSAPATAGHAGTISNELLCRLGSRLPVVQSAPLSL